MNQVGIIGLGHVGATTALLMAQRGHIGHLVLVDKNEAKVKSEQVDLQDQIALLGTDTTVSVQDYNHEQWEQLRNLDVLVYCAGDIKLLREHKGNRDFELQMTSQVVKEIAPKIKNSSFQGVIVTITNPCDVIARLLQEYLDYPTNKILGTGTGLETARMHHAVAETLHCNYHDVTGYVFGEHGDTMFPVWSSVQVAGQPITKFDLDLPKLTKKIVEGGYVIYAGKQYTNNGIATRANLDVEAVLSDAQRALPVSAYDEHEQLYIGQLAVIGRHGVEKTVSLELNDAEKAAYHNSVQAIENNYQRVQ
ncbi:putative L-2-hydroxyisocaproate dehydrogenase [Bombilactobacillus mellifer]|uniref:Putative L-2-hydroxyisocaproate dehydrogenase n=1 Tax=Bombilactobacillus mellifer TaxID=1218492 RepID=A0A0F4LU19_9LACO|nr:hypothetical protein [Bombilactobacillus mellifer]KJY61863.1 putative L-2-hydroxyisocaproate dehydrogenase [Bombilactobacillus mellifer]